MPSKIEGLPGVILEALSCATPVVTSDVGGIKEAVEDGYNGYCIKGHELHNYVEAVEKILEDKEFQEKLKSNSRKIINEKFTMNKISDQFIKEYQKILS